MKTKINQFKKLALALIVLPLLGVVLLNSTSVSTRAWDNAADHGTIAPARASDAATDVAAIYKDSKCLMCHGPKAAKFFDATLPDEKLVEAILKGKKSEKPPNMPGYEEKGMTLEQATALVAYMKSLKL